MNDDVDDAVRGVIMLVQILDDGSLYIADVGLQHVGNYSCHDERWSDVMQTHILDVHGAYTWAF